MNAFLRERMEATGRRVLAPVASLADLTVKVEVLPRRLHEHLADYDVGAQLNARLAAAVLGDARALLHSDGQELD